MKKSFLTVSIVLATGVLLLSLGFYFFYKLRDSTTVLHEDLIARLPTEVSGWEITDRPVADTPEMKKAVGEMLNYSTALMREYKRPGKSIAVYAAYWVPHKFNPRLIAIHTPDVCWVGNGWTMSEPDYNYPLSSGGRKLWPAQKRLFTVGPNALHVIYWHVVDGKLSGYASGPASASISFMDNFWNDIRRSSGEQFFIRLSSPQPWSEWIGDPLFERIISTFSPVLDAEPRVETKR